LLRSIEWTTFLEATYDVALEQATVILRYFLAAGRIQAAQNLLGLLPPELASIDEPEEIATEYLHYRQFFLIWDAIARVVECQSQEVSFTQGQGTAAFRDARAAWISEYAALIDQAYDHIVRLFTTEWLAEEEIPDDDRAAYKRQDERARIRQIYVPELIIRLHYLLYSSRNFIPENLKRAIQLANVVADSRYRLYETFSGNGGRTLADYLKVVRQAVVAGLENGGSDPFRIITSP
jgi:nuclear pore complex protein Nup107